MLRKSLALLLLLAACGTGGGGSVSPRPPQTVVLVSLDGFRWDYLDRPEAAGLRAIAASGVRARQMEPVFPTKTFPNHYSLVTGLWAEHHGIVGNTMEDATLGRFIISDTVAVRTSGWWGGSRSGSRRKNRAGMRPRCSGPDPRLRSGVRRPSWYERYDDRLVARRPDPEGAGMAGPAA